MNPIAASTLGGLAFMAFIFVLQNLPSTKRRYQKMDDRALLRANVSAKMMRRCFLIITIVAPFVLVQPIILLRSSEIATVFICLMVLTIIGGIATFWMHWDIVRLSQSEIEYRKFRKEKEDTEPAPGHVPSQAAADGDL